MAVPKSVHANPYHQAMSKLPGGSGQPFDTSRSAVFGQSLRPSSAGRAPTGPPSAANNHQNNTFGAGSGNDDMNATNPFFPGRLRVNQSSPPNNRPNSPGDT